MIGRTVLVNPTLPRSTAEVIAEMLASITRVRRDIVDRAQLLLPESDRVPTLTGRILTGLERGASNFNSKSPVQSLVLNHPSVRS